MRTRKTNKKSLDLIGKRLIAASRLTEPELDAIAAADGLFDGVLRRISREEAVAPAAEVFANARRFRAVYVGGAAVAATVVMMVSGIFLEQRSANDVSNNIEIPVSRPGPARSEITPQVIVKGFTAGRADYELPVSSNKPTVQKAIFRDERAQPPAARFASYDRGAERNFVALTYTGDGGESARGGRVIRMDVPRSTLFAMGFDVPIENDSPTIKADILVGPDGVTRAVRLVE